jgi:heptaprenyl diphosphate synthase
MKVRDNKVKKIAFCGLILALALIAGYVESMVPVAVAIPGIKLGAANSVILILLYMVGVKEAYFVNISRVVLAGFLFGSMSSILYSLSGAVLSMLLMTLLKKTDRFSISGVSMAGGVFHNVGQLMMAAWVLETTAVWYYLPVLIISGSITGLLIGFLTGEICKRIPYIG